MQTTISEAAEVARTIVKQAGGRRLQVMTGIKPISATTEYLGGALFSVPRCFGEAVRVDGKAINRIEVVLDFSDTYIVRFAYSRTRGGIPSLRVIKEFAGIYADDLENLISSETGLATRL